MPKSAISSLLLSSHYINLYLDTVYTVYLYTNLFICIILIILIFYGGVIGREVVSFLLFLGIIIC